MNLIVFGASGRTGHNLVQQALALGHEVTAFVRDPAKLSISHPDLHFFQGDVYDYRSVEKSMKGKDVVISALGALSPFKLDRVVIEGIKHVVKVMKDENINRFIYLSALGVLDSRKEAGFVLRYIAPRILKTEFEGHEIKENIIRESNLNWTIVRAANLTSGPLKGEYRSGESITSNSFLPTISRADVADLMLRQISDDTHIQKCIKIMY